MLRHGWQPRSISGSIVQDLRILFWKLCLRSSQQILAYFTSSQLFGLFTSTVMTVHTRFSYLSLFRRVDVV
jgi:hypothetical protein